MTKSPAFQTVIDDLLDAAKPFPAYFLQTFSDIHSADLDLLKNVWEKVSLQRKQQLLEDLRDLAETDTLTNFDSVGLAFLKDPAPEVRILATRMLRECEDRKLVPLFLEALRTDPSADVQSASASALGLFVFLGELEEVPDKVLKEIEEALLLKTGDPSKQVRRAALEALGNSSRPEVPEQIETAIHQKDPDWVVSALVAMGRSSDEQWEKHILARLRNANDDIRSAAIEAAGEIGLPAAREPLLDMLEDEEDVEVRHSIIQALSRIGGEGVRATLQELLELEEDEEEIEFIEDALETLLISDDAGLLDIFDFDSAEDLQADDGHEDHP